MRFEHVDPIVRAVLYEGYVLYPYRATSIKNQQRFTFGGVYPRAWCEAARNGDAWRMRTECLVAGGDEVSVSVTVRFLQLVAREGPTVWHEAVERVVVLPEQSIGALRSSEATRFTFEFAWEPAPEDDRRGEPIAGEIAVSTEHLGDGLHRLAIEIDNATALETAVADTRHVARDAALSRCFASTHTILGVRGGELVSLTEPPEALREATLACRNVGTWPVLVGERGRRDTMLSSPIILDDYPSIAPESPDDLFDASEIDEILTLRILTLTEEERAEVRASDPRARALLERTLALGPGALARLHGSMTSMRSGRSPRGVAPGDRVRLRPRGRGDVFDLALAGMEATVASVEHDYDGRAHVAVTVDADPGRDLGELGMPGHRFFFGADELEPIATGEAVA